MSELKIEQIGADAVFNVKIVASSSKTAIAGCLDGMLKIKVSAPPKKGKANQAIIKFLAGKMGVKKRQITIATGLRSTIKQIHIRNVTIREVEAKITTGPAA